MIHGSVDASPLRSAVWLALIVGAALGCESKEPPPKPVEKAEEEPAEEVEAEPTPEQERALANELHRKHLDAEPEEEGEEVDCDACHAIRGKAKMPTPHRCLGCHDGQTSAIHAQTANEQARECLTCHNFLAEEVDPWRCASCHSRATSKVQPARELEDAPQITVHAEEWCGNCHVPHGDKAMDPGLCTDCHEEVTSDHHAQELKDPAQCMECHVAHDPAAVAKTSCNECHRDDVGRAVTFKGHDDCLTCHNPHGAAQIDTCVNCHRAKRTLASETKGHGSCESCHNPHRPMDSARASCTGCHEGIELAHPPDQRRGTCVGCHRIHPVGGRLVQSLACVHCHDAARTETSFHAGGTTCGSCHRPHAFALRDAGVALCLDCHKKGAGGAAGQGGGAKAISSIEGHAGCDDCHKNAAHAPGGPKTECTTCHHEVKKTLTKGHEDCGACHEPHRGTVTSKCLDCHADKPGAGHQKAKAKCTDCHRAHGPKGRGTPRACTSCHDSPLPSLHQIPDHRNCTDCHAFHDTSAPRGRGGCLQPCHAKLIEHEPSAKSCIGCHPFGGNSP